VVELLTQYFDEPFGDSSAIPMLYLAQMTRAHVTVALSGDGADELFGGYRRYRHGLIEERLRMIFPTWFRRSVISAGGRHYPKFDYLPQIFRAKTMLSNLARELGDAYFTSMSAFRDDRLDAILSAEFRNKLGGYSPRDAFRDRFEAFRHLDPLQQMQAVDLDTYLPGDILVKTDRASMAFSLEGRAPWLDPRIVELSLGLPPDWKIRGRSGKYIFKQTVAPVVPAAIIERRKMGFSIPLGSWMRSSLRRVFERYVFAPAMECYLSFDEVRILWAEHQSGSHNHERKLWNLLILAAWDAQYGRGSRKSSNVRQLSQLNDK
jgi:asparagine synthase (glutamine-hydrolysing)